MCAYCPAKDQQKAQFWRVAERAGAEESLKTRQEPPSPIFAGRRPAGQEDLQPRRQDGAGSDSLAQAVSSLYMAFSPLPK